MHSYKLPGLSNYRFNKDGECRRINGTGERKKKAFTGRWINGVYHPCTPKYQLVNDEGEYEYIELAEVLQYIKHIDLLRSKLTI